METLSVSSLSRLGGNSSGLGTLITIDTLVVDEAHRSHGIGERLVGVALEAAARCSAQAVEAVSHHRRVDARRFYERLGFEVTSNYFVRTP
jgi:GNAT superfamily N-acetyltransferase